MYIQRNKLKAIEQIDRARGDDIDLDRRRSTSNWHPRLPIPPADFPSNLNFSLSQEEAEFIIDRINFSCPESLLSFLATNCNVANSDTPWEHPQYAEFTIQHKELLSHARLFSEVMYGAALSYNFQLATLRNNEALITKHKINFDKWLTSLPTNEINNWSLNRLWDLTHEKGHTITPQTRSFVQQWVEYVKASPLCLLSSKDSLSLIKNREIKLKGTRSRFINYRALEQWSGNSGTSKLVYRWPNVKVLLQDLSQGMNQEAKC